MARKTRKHTKSTKGIYSIPELRRAFEHVEETMDEMIRNKESKADMIAHIRKEWQKVFHKTLDKSSADALITHRMESRRTPHSMKGGASALAGAPVEYVMRPGVYLDQGTRPGPDGGLTKTVGGGFGHYPQYVDRGFFNPEIARGNDPVPNQSTFLLPRVGMGSNIVTPLTPSVTPSVKGGKRTIKTRKNKKLRGKTYGGAAMFDQAFMRPFSPGASPFDPLVDLQRMSSGAVTGPSPDSTQNPPQYRVGSAYPTAVNINV
jgi:hypothetical protein